MPFSWEKTKKNTIKTKIRRAKTMATAGHSDIKLRHPEWVRDATKHLFTDLEFKIKEDILKRQKFALDRRFKRIGK